MWSNQYKCVPLKLFLFFIYLFPSFFVFVVFGVDFVCFYSLIAIVIKPINLTTFISK